MEKRYLQDRTDFFVLMMDLEQKKDPIGPEEYPCIAVYHLDAVDGPLHIEYVYLSDFKGA